jgi:hypothetical protein
MSQPIMGLARVVQNFNIEHADEVARAAVEETVVPVALGGISRETVSLWRNGQKEAAE